MGRQHSQLRRSARRSAEGDEVPEGRCRRGSGECQPGRDGSRGAEPGAYGSPAMTQAAAQPTNLKEIQRRMAAAVMHPLTRSETMPRRRRDGASNASEAEAIIRPNDRLTSFERLEIYNRQYWFRLYTSFEEDFPGLEAILGRAKFDRLMREYLTDCPSESFTLRNLGSRLEGWLRSHPQFIAPHETLALDM